MEPLNDDELSEILRKLETAPVPPLLEGRILGPRKEDTRNPWWKRILSYSVRIPVPVFTLLLFAFFTLAVFAIRTSRGVPPTTGAQIPASVHGNDESAGTTTNQVALMGTPDLPNSTPHDRRTTTSNSTGDAIRLDDKTLIVSGGAADRNLMSSFQPAYPSAAKNVGLHGVVRLRVRIGTDGHVTEATAVSGNPVLFPAAIEAVNHRVYRPTLLNGKPIAVVSQVDVTFELDVALISSLVQ